MDERAFGKAAEPQTLRATSQCHGGLSAGRIRRPPQRRFSQVLALEGMAGLASRTPSGGRLRCERPYDVILQHGTG